MTLPAAAPALGGGNAERGTGGAFLPTRVLEVELAGPLPKLDYDGHYGRAWILVRLHTEPIGVCVIALPREGIAPDALAQIIWRDLNTVIIERFAAAGLAAPAALTGSGLTVAPEAWPFLRRRAEVLADAPFI
ncbi:MAG TPA: hypothetical protein VN714_30295, partial [Trebonia sp.]|nr:hypothetical protein [Trebonia sp.]